MRGLVILGVFGVLIGIGTIAYSVNGILGQHRDIQTSVSVGANVLDSRVEATRHSLVTVYDPAVSFEYRIGGQRFVSERAMPASEPGTRSWAEGVVSDNPPGKRTTAHVPVGRPTEAFLLKRYSSMPYTSYLFGILMLFAGLHILRDQRRRFLDPPKPEVTHDGWYRLASPWQVSQAVVVFGCSGLAWVLAGVPAWGHYVAVSEPPIAPLFVVYLALYNGVGLILLGIAARALLIGFRLRDPELHVERLRPETGATLRVRLRQEVRRPLTVKRVTLSLVCLRAQQVGVGATVVDHEKTLYRWEQSILAGEEFGELETIGREFHFEVPAHCPPSTPSDDRSNERVRWELRYRASIRGWLAFPDKFVLDMKSGRPNTSDRAETVAPAMSAM